MRVIGTQSRRLALVLNTLIWVALLSEPVAAKVTASLSHSTILVNEQVTLRIEKDSQDSTGSPDFSILEQDFDVSNSSTRSQVSVFNGNVQASYVWSVALTPKRVGNVVIPALRVGNELTEPLTLIVRDLDPLLKNSIRDSVFFEIDVSPNEQYVQGAIYVTRRLFFVSSVQLVSNLPTTPDISNAAVVDLGAATWESQVRNGIGYSVAEQRFVIFAEKSGLIELPAETISVSVLNPTTRRRMGLRVTSEAREINIRPIPRHYPADTPWLPATSVELEQTFTPLDLENLQVGEALYRTISVSAMDADASAIADLTVPTSSSLKVYPDDPISENELVDRRIRGKKQFHYNMIPTRALTGELAEVTVIWWNTETERIETTILNSESVKVFGDGPETSIVEEQVQLPASIDSQSSTKSILTYDEVGSEYVLSDYIWPTIAVVGWLVAVLLVFRQLKNHTVIERKRDPKTNPSMSNLKQAVSNQDSNQIKHEIVEWLSKRLDVSKVHAGRLLFKNPSGQLLLNELNNAIYADLPDPIVLEIEDIEQTINSIVRDAESSNHAALNPREALYAVS